MLKESYQMLINGEWVESASGETFKAYNPANGEVIATVAKGSTEDVDRAVAAARNAFDNGKWPKYPAGRRAKVLNKVASIMRKRFDELVELEVLNSGKSLSAAQGQVHQAIEDFEFYAGAIVSHTGETKPVPNISSCATFISFVTSVITVGIYQCPFSNSAPSGRLPPYANVAPCWTAS